MSLGFFHGIRARLLVLMALVVFPIAFVSVGLATMTYNSVIETIAAAQAEAPKNYEMRTRLWHVGIVRSLASAEILLEIEHEHNDNCYLSAQKFLEKNIDFIATYILFSNNDECFANRDPSLSIEKIREIGKEQSEKQKIDSIEVLNYYGQTRLDAIETTSGLKIVVYRKSSDPKGRFRTSVLLISPRLLENAYRYGKYEMGDVALLNKAGLIVSTRQESNAAQTWIPDSMPALDTQKRWVGMSRAGDKSDYSLTPLPMPGLALLVRYSNAANHAALTQFVILWLTPILTIILLFLTYARVIQHEIIYWINEIRLAAQAKAVQLAPNIMAPVSPDMPLELRAVSEALNTMAAEADTRENALQQSLDKNKHLVREFHHRVKNSLQVIQSYLALTRRLQPSSSQRIIVETEARVQVLSTCYKLALSDGQIRAISIKLLMEETVRNLESLMGSTGMTIDTAIATVGDLGVDRAIPLGLAIVESAIVGCALADKPTISMTCNLRDDGQCDFAIRSKQDFSAPPSRIMAGLAQQLSADVVPTDATVILHWRFMPETPQTAKQQ